MLNRQRQLAAVAIGLSIVIALFLGPCRRELVPSRLTIHAPLQDVQTVILDNEIVTSPTGVIEIIPIDYGPHVLRFDLADGRVLWTTFFHADAGMDRQLGVAVDSKPGSKLATVRMTITRFETVHGVTRTVFSKAVETTSTSERKPLVLDWI